MATSSTGLGGDNTITGTDGADKIIAGGGSDTIDGGAGSDFINAGGGNDTIVYDQNDYKILGGGGMDTLWFMAGGQRLKLSNTAVSGIERLLLDGGWNQVWLSAADIVRVSDNDQLIVDGNDINVLWITDSGWQFGGLTADGKSQVLVNGQAKMIVSLQLYVDGFSSNASISVQGDQSVTEDDASPLLLSTGTLTVTDPNPGQGLLLDVDQDYSNGLGVLHFTLNQAWSTDHPAVYDYTYSVSNAAVQYLAGGQEISDYFILRAIDGFSTYVTFTITGVNDPAIITGTNDASVTEDESVDAQGYLVTEGTVTISDADLGQSKFATLNLTGSKGGTLKIDSTGISNSDGSVSYAFTYKILNSSVQDLSSNDHIRDSFALTSFDGETIQSIDITINGANDLSLNTDPLTIYVSEYGDGSALESSGIPHSIESEIPVSGAISVAFIADSANPPYLGAFEIFSSGGKYYWNFSIDDKLIDYLRINESMSEKFEIIATDGTSTLTKVVSVVLTGSEDSTELIDATGDGSGQIYYMGNNRIVRGLGGNDYLEGQGDSHRVYGDAGNDIFQMDALINSLIRGGDGDDKFNIGNVTSGNEIYGDNGDDLFIFNSLSNQHIWGGPGSDTFKVNASNNMGSAPVLYDFDFGPLADGGDRIDLRSIGTPDSLKLALTQSSIDPSQYFLTAGEGLTKWTIFTIVGTDLTMAELSNHLVT